MSTWSTWTKHWKSQWRRHESKYQAAAVAGVAVVPVVGPALAGAYLAVKAANEQQKVIDATRAATKQLAQQPLAVVNTSAQSLGATGEIQFSKNIQQWIPVGLIFIIVMYFIFKE